MPRSLPFHEMRMQSCARSRGSVCLRAEPTAAVCAAEPGVSQSGCVGQLFALLWFAVSICLAARVRYNSTSKLTWMPRGPLLPLDSVSRFGCGEHVVQTACHYSFPVPSSFFLLVSSFFLLKPEAGRVSVFPHCRARHTFARCRMGTIAWSHVVTRPHDHTTTGRTSRGRMVTW